MPSIVVLISVYSKSPSGPDSRPIPDCFIPPNGWVHAAPAALMAKVPVRTRLDTSSASTWSSVNTDPASPKRESFAIPTASSMSSYSIRQYTGPKISSCATAIRLLTSVSRVGS